MVPRKPPRSRKPQVRAPQTTEHHGPSPSEAEQDQRCRTPRTTLLLWGLFLLVLLYVSIGFWPILPLEGDEAAIANGAAQLAHVPTLDTNELYRYHFQPLSYTLVTWGKRWLNIEPLTTLGILTWLGFASFLGFGSRFCSRLTDVSFPVAGLILLLFQETFTAAYYANTSMIAAGFLAPAAVLLKRGTWQSSLGAGLLFGVAILSRFDALLMAPVLGLLVVGKRRKHLINSAIFTGVAALVVLLLIWLLGVSLSSIRSEVTTHRTLSQNLSWALANYLSLFNPFVIVLALVGLGVCLAWRQWRLFGLTVLGLAPLVAAYGRGVTTPKYMLFAIPFVALAVAVAFRWIRHLGNPRWRTISVLLVAVFFLQQYSVRLTGPSLQQQLVGPHSDVFWTADAFRMRTSYALAPLMWNTLKSCAGGNLATCHHELQRFTAEQPTGDILANTGGYWLSVNCLVYEMRQCGYLPVTVKPLPPTHRGTSPRKPWNIQAFRNRQGLTCQVYWLEPLHLPATFLYDKAQTRLASSSAGEPCPYTFFDFTWGTEQNIVEIPSHFETVTLDLRKKSPRQ